MAIVEKHIEPVTGWSLDQIVERVTELGAPLTNVTIEPVMMEGPWGHITVPSIVWYGEQI